MKIADRARYPVPPPRSGVTAPALSAISEASWQRTVVEGLRVHGWRVFHDRVAWRSDVGYPDLTAIHVGQRRVVWIELKSERGSLSAKQESWRDTLLAAGHEWFLFRPSDWPTAERVIRGERLVATEPKE